MMTSRTVTPVWCTETLPSTVSAENRGPAEKLATCQSPSSSASEAVELGRRRVQLPVSAPVILGGGLTRLSSWARERPSRSRPTVVDSSAEAYLAETFQDPSRSLRCLV